MLPRQTMQTCLPATDPTTNVCLQYPIAYDGYCGVDTGKRCPNDECCGMNGQCQSFGSSVCYLSSHACQLGYGVCIMDDYTNWANVPRVICTSTVTIYSTGTPTASPTTSIQASPTHSVAAADAGPIAAAPGLPTPPTPWMIYGVHTDWAVQNPPVYAFLFKVNPMTYGAFLNIASDFQSGPMASHVDQILAAASLVPPELRKRGFIYNVAVMPWGGMKGVTDQALAQLVAACRDAENRGVHVIVRYAHEMNGLWYPWGQDRQEYKDGFRRVALAIRAGSPKTEMMWAPNWFDCTGKPKDWDPYYQWYPGDDVVDWVALSMYFFSNQWPLQNDVPPMDTLIRGFTGNYGTCSYWSAFYDRFAKEKGRKLALAETGAPWIEDRTSWYGSTPLTRMRAWWQQVYNSTIHEQFPWYQMAVWFEYRKWEDGQMREFRIGNDPERLRVFQQDLAPQWRVMYYDRP